MSILIRGGYVINPATSMEENADVYIEGNEVKEIGKNLKVEATQVIDANGCYVMPGFIDLHEAVQFFQHHLLKKLCPHFVFSSPFSSIN